MLTGLDFEVAKTTAPAAPNRADVACFIGFVPRRARSPLTAAVRAQLRAGGWIDGPWRLPVERPVDALLHLPVVVDDWEAFAALFAWDARLLRAGGSERCATYLGSAVRSFFAHGGRRAFIVRTGDPWPYLGGDPRADLRAARLAALVPSARPFDATDPRLWRGFEHVYALPEVSHVCLPDLADVCAREPDASRVELTLPDAPEVFVECSEHEPALPLDSPLHHVSAPRVTHEGYTAWSAALFHAHRFLARHRRDALLVAALPLPTLDVRAPEGGAYAQSDALLFLRQAGVLEPEGAREAPPGSAASAFVQLVWPWLGTNRSTDLPQHLEPGDGVLAGLLATNALQRGTFRSVAGTYLPAVGSQEPVPHMGLGPESPTARLAERVCLIGPEPDGIALLSDVTSSPDPAWRSGGVSRLMSALLRAARRVGEAHVFDANGPELWGHVRGSLEGVLDGFFRAGALGGKSPAEAFSVRCDLSTMTQNDLDNGRVRAEVTVLPASAISRVTVSLELAAAGAEARLSEVA